MKRREFMRLGSGLLIAQAAAACGASRLTAPEQVAQPDTQPLDPSRVGPLLVSKPSGAGGTLTQVLEDLGLSPVGSYYSGKELSGFIVTSLMGENYIHGYVIAINGGHFFADSVQSVKVDPGSRVEIYRGLPCPNPASC